MMNAESKKNALHARKRLHLAAPLAGRDVAEGAGARGTRKVLSAWGEAVGIRRGRSFAARRTRGPDSAPVDALGRRRAGASATARSRPRPGGAAGPAALRGA